MTSAGVAMAAAGRELIDAASAGDRLKARTLLRAGVSADVRSLDHAPLPIAVENSDLGMVVLLLSHGATPSLKPSPNPAHQPVGPLSSRCRLHSSGTFSGLPRTVPPSLLTRTAPTGALRGFEMCFGLQNITSAFRSVRRSE